MSAAQQLAANSIVHVICERPGGAPTAGTGTIVSSEGHVLTARHVAPDGSDCTARLGSREGASRRLVPVGEVSRYDYALLSLTRLPGEVFAPVPVAGGTSNLRNAEVTLFGFPGGGAVSYSVQAGTITNPDRDDEGMMESLTMTAPGWSGGPVVSAGQIVGIVGGAEYDALGQVINYAVLSSDVFRADLRALRNDIAADRTEDRIAAIEAALLGDGACIELLRDALVEKHPDLFPALVANSGEPKGSELTKQSEFWVTITTGPAQWLDCKEGNLRKSHYFPMGLILHPLRDIVVSDANGTSKTWTIFQTEYGLPVFIDERAIEPVVENVGYVFADGIFVAKLCGPSDDADCNPGLDLPPYNNNSAHWPYMSGWDSYLRIDDAAALEASFAEYLEFRANQDLHFSDEPPRSRRFVPRLPERLEDDPACKPQKAWLYEFAKRFDPTRSANNSEFDEMVTFSFCNLPPSGAGRRTAGYRPVKVVTANIARETFDDLWYAQVLASPIELVKSLSTVLPDTPSAEIEVIECGQNPDVQRDLGDIALMQNPVSLSSVLSHETASAPIAEGRQWSHRFRFFQPNQGNSSSRTLRRVPLFQHIALQIFCGDDREPMRAASVYISFRPVIDQPLDLDMKRIENLYISNFSEYGFEGRRHINAGYIDRICDNLEYRGWLETVTSEIAGHAMTSQAASRLGVGSDIVANHFAHLILATLFFTEVRLQLQESPYGGCR